MSGATKFRFSAMGVPNMEIHATGDGSLSIGGAAPTPTRVLLAANGHVGIGTASRTERLDVFGSGDVSARIEGEDQAFLVFDGVNQP